MKIGRLLAVALPLFGQITDRNAPAFEVASIRESAFSSRGVAGGCHGSDTQYTPAQEATAPPLGYCRITDARLSHLIGIAYGVTMRNLKTRPDWIQRGDLRFNVLAKAEEGAQPTERELLTMLQNLLVERFQLRYHLETAEQSGFELTVAKNGPKLKPSTSDQVFISFSGPRGELMPKPVAGRPTILTARKYSMANLVNMLTFVTVKPVVDKTGLEGVYDLTLTWDDEGGPALSTALREQLGLAISTTKVPVSTLVVDAAAKPSEN